MQHVYNLSGGYYGNHTQRRPSQTCRWWLVLTCQCGGVSERADLGVGQSSEEGDDRVHHVLVVDDAVLTLAHQHRNELAEAGLEPLPLGPCYSERVVPAIL